MRDTAHIDSQNFSHSCDRCGIPCYPQKTANGYLCEVCIRGCEYCGELADSLYAYEWDTPATWEHPGDNGKMLVCGACLESFQRRRVSA